MKKFICILLTVCVFLCCISTGVSAVDDRSAGENSRFTGLVSMSASISISNIGRTVTSVDMILRSGYTAELQVVLVQFDGIMTDELKEWNVEITEEDSGAWAGVWYVESGYFYYSEVSVDIYDSNGKYIETVSLETNTEYYG